MRIPLLAAFLLTAALPAQWPYNVNFNGNLTGPIVFEGQPYLAIYNLLPRTVENGAPHALVNVQRPTPGQSQLRLVVDHLWFFERTPCAHGRDVRLDDVVPNGAIWQGTVGRDGKAMHRNVNQTLQWQTAASPAIGSQPMGTLRYDLSSGPLQRCRPGVTPQSPAFLALCRWEVLPAPEPVQFTGFETGSLDELVFSAGGVGVQGAVVHTGSHALRCNQPLEDYAYGTLLNDRVTGVPGDPLNLLDTYTTFYFRFATHSSRSRIAEVSGVLGATKLRLDLETNRRLSVEDFNFANRFVGTTVLQPDTWYRIRWYVGTGMPGPTEVWIDGAVELSIPNAALSLEATRVVHIGRSSTCCGPIDFYFDDVAISRHGFVADSRVGFLLPQASGVNGGWTGSFLDLDDWPHDGDATVASTATPGAVLTAAMQDAAATGISGSVLAVKAMAILRREDPLVWTPSAVRLLSGTAFAETSSWDGGDLLYKLRSRLHLVDPATGLPWLLPGIDGLEVGVAQGTTGLFTRVTAVGASVLFVP
jgi:hypothetical protein